MTLRQHLKYWLFGRCPGLAGRFRYFGTTVHFPKGSLSFRAACEQGIFETENITVLRTLVQPGTCMFDVGANIGLMAIPVLCFEPAAKVISFEPSANVLPSLRRTMAESPLRTRWSLVEKAVGAETGTVTFTLSQASESLFDGIRPTRRVEVAGSVEVAMTTIDETWQSLGRPKVSVIKIDVEGGESGVLRGATQCIQQERPAILLEWNRQNLAAYDIPLATLLHFAAEWKYEVLAIPGFQRVDSERQLALHMAFTENFLLSPLS